MPQQPTSISAYEARAEAFADQYESLAFEDVHQSILDLLPQTPGRVLDVGAGSGRDAAWFAYHGHDVVAVEPSEAMRREARERHVDPRIRWSNDSLPGLVATHRLGIQFEFILVNAVWMHVHPDDRTRAFRKLATLLAPGGRIALSLRTGPSDTDRPMYAVSSAELEQLGRTFGLRTMRISSTEDRLGRSDVRWETIVLGYPDDETGALPLLRHIVLRDDKASTYKLALLRVVARIADSAPGMARQDDEGNVSLPLGLVALYWIRSMKPLVEAGYPQTPTNQYGRGLGFVKAAFLALRGIAPFDLRIGMRFEGDNARNLFRALVDAAATICLMPANFITYPGGTDKVFGTRRRPVRWQGASLVLDESCLRSFGEFVVPGTVWRTLSHLNVWIEPVLLAEWIALIQQYAIKQGRELIHDTLARALTWLDPVHDTRLARSRALQLLDTGATLCCVWTGRRLGRNALDIDHCFPFAAWPCSDLWNLLPASPEVNRRLKRDRLVTPARLEAAREAISDWWSKAWIGDHMPWRPRFFDEARSSLPLGEARGTSLGDVFEGIQVRRALLRVDQQLPEWRD